MFKPILQIRRCTSRWISSVSSQGLKKERLRRDIFYVPGSDERKLTSCLKSNADSIVFDLEDSVPLNKKGAARQQVFQTFNLGRSEKTVRINSIGSGQEMDDLNIILRSKSLDAIVIPKVHSTKEIDFVCKMIEFVNPGRRGLIRLLPSIESGMGLMNIREIACADPMVDGLIFAAEDYCADVGVTRTNSRNEMLFARQMVVTTAAAFGIQSIDLVCVDYKDTNILEEECKEGKTFGFTGKQAIHPKQLEIIHRTFVPSTEEIEKASKILAGYEDNMKRGIGAFTLDRKMIDMPVVRWAQKTLAKSEAIKLEIKT